PHRQVAAQARAGAPHQGLSVLHGNRARGRQEVPRVRERPLTAGPRNIVTSRIRRTLTILVCCAGVCACRAEQERAPAATAAESADARVKALADEFVSAYFDRSPESATLFGVPGRHHDKLTDNSLDALKAWEAREDALLTQLKQIEPARI